MSTGTQPMKTEICTLLGRHMYIPVHIKVVVQALFTKMEITRFVHLFKIKTLPQMGQIPKFTLQIALQ